MRDHATYPSTFFLANLYIYSYVSRLIQFQNLVALKKRDLKSKALATREACEAFGLLVEAVREGPAEEQELIEAVRKNKDVAMQVCNLKWA